MKGWLSRTTRHRKGQKDDMAIALGVLAPHSLPGSRHIPLDARLEP